MKKILFGLLIILFPVAVFAQTNLTKYPVGTCRLIDGSTGYYQQMSDGTWAGPNDRLNTCDSLFGNGIFSNQMGFNSELANMTQREWLLRCVLQNSLLPRPECQGYNPLTGNSWFNGLLSYPQLGRDHLSFTTGNSSIYMDLSNTDPKDQWKGALLGVGLGWLFNQLTS